MKKYAWVLALSPFLSFSSTAQKLVSDCSPTVNEVHFAPQVPWAIDGKISDWEILLGKGKGSPNKPFEPSVAAQNNWFTDGNPVDLDDAEKKADIKLAAYTYDQYNVYFYVRLAHKSNDANTIYYFIDVNVDGFL